MSDRAVNIKRIKSYPDTDNVIAGASLQGEVHNIVIITIHEAQHKGQEDEVDIWKKEGELTEILTGMGDPYGTRIELNPVDRHDENCSNLIDNLFQLELIEERDIQKFENYDDLDLCRKATALFKKQGSVNDYNASQTLIEDIRDEAKARKKGYSHLVLGDTGNVYLASELDTLKFFVARNYADKAVVLFEDEQVERFLKEKGKTLLQSIKNKELRAKVVSAVENLVTANRNSYPEALKQIGKKNKRAAGKSKLRTRVKFPGATMPASDINIVRDFSKYPGHRQAKHGENSGEEFRDNLLLPAFKKSGKITVDLTGTVGLGSGFLEEAFGGLVRLGIKLTRENLIITASAEEFEEVWSYIDQATQKIKLAREK